jgi:hypothetical protein
VTVGRVTILDEVRSAYRAGLCILPAASDGSRRPDVLTWTAYQTRRPTSEPIGGLPDVSVTWHLRMTTE